MSRFRPKVVPDDITEWLKEENGGRILLALTKDETTGQFHGVFRVPPGGARVPRYVAESLSADDLERQIQVQEGRRHRFVTAAADQTSRGLYFLCVFEAPDIKIVPQAQGGDSEAPAAQPVNPPRPKCGLTVKVNGKTNKYACNVEVFAADGAPKGFRNRCDFDKNVCTLHVPPGRYTVRPSGWSDQRSPRGEKGVLNFSPPSTDITCTGGEALTVEFEAQGIEY